jgi:hypothetical protein
MIGSLEKRIVAQHRSNEASKRLETIPGIDGQAGVGIGRQARTFLQIPDAKLRRRQKQRSYSGVQSDRTRNAMYGCDRTGCEVKALQRSLPDEALGNRRARASTENSTSDSLCRTGAMLP